MNLKTLSYLIPYFASAFISFGIAFYAWQRRQMPGSKSFGIMVLSQAVWTFGYVCELVTPTLQGKVFWDNMQFVTWFIWPLSFFAFVCEFSGRRWRRPRLLWSLLSVPAVIFFLILFAEKQYHLIRPDSVLIPGEPFSALYYEFSMVVLIATAYLYTLVFSGIYLLVKRFARAQHGLYRKQTGFILVGTLIPIIGGFLTLFEVILTDQRDMTPLTFAISNMIIAWALYRYGLFDIVPVARDKVVENMSELVFVLDVQNRFVDINPAAQEVLGIHNGEIIGKPVQEILAQWSHLLNLLDANDESMMETKVSYEEDAYFLAIKMTPLYNDSRELNGRLIVARDITDMKIAEQKLQEHAAQLELANNELLALSAVKDQFVTNVSHELRTPLTNLKLYHDLLLRNTEQLPAYINVLQRETNRLELIIEDLLTLSRLDQRKDMMRAEETDLNLLVKTLVLDRQRLAAQSGIDLQYELEFDLPLVWIDGSMITQVLSILLTNAVNYTPGGGSVTVLTQIKKDCEQRSWFGFCVKDTGYGITAVDQEHLFTRFFRGEASKQTGSAGTGLGLAIAKEIVDQHHGIIDIHSSGIPGEGTLVTIWLPSSRKANTVAINSTPHLPR